MFDTAGRPHHGLNALSPLQSFSPLQPVAITGKQRTPSHSRTSSSQTIPSLNSSPVRNGGLGLNLGGGPGRSPKPSLITTSLNKIGSGPSSAPLEMESNSTSRAPSLTRSLSRRESLVAAVNMMSEYAPSSPGTPGSGGGRGGLISKLTLVRAPSRSQAHKSADEKTSPERRRTKSSGNLASFGLSTSGSSALSTSASGPANLSALLSPSANTQFGRSPGPADFGSPMKTSDSGHRASFLFDTPIGDPVRSPLVGAINIHEQHKNLSPEQVVELVDSLKSPVLAGDRSSTSMSRSGSMKRLRLDSDVSLASKALDDRTELEPVEYVEMNDDVLLPYVDRPSEVAELIEQPNNVSNVLSCPPMMTEKLNSRLDHRLSSFKSFDRHSPKLPEPRIHQTGVPSNLKNGPLMNSSSTSS